VDCMVTCPRDTCPRDTCPRDTCPRDTCPRDTCPRDTCPRDTCPRDTCPRDTWGVVGYRGAARGECKQDSNADRRAPSRLSAVVLVVYEVSTSAVPSCVSSSAIVVVVEQWLMHGRRNTLEKTSDSRLLSGSLFERI
jgi:hypothetical protein